MSASEASVCQSDTATPCLNNVPATSTKLCPFFSASALTRLFRRELPDFLTPRTKNAVAPGPSFTVNPTPLYITDLWPTIHSNFLDLHSPVRNCRLDNAGGQ